MYYVHCKKNNLHTVCNGKLIKAIMQHLMATLNVSAQQF